MSDDGYEGIPCPVPNCEGYLKNTDDHEIECEFGHIVERVSRGESGLVTGK